MTVSIDADSAQRLLSEGAIWFDTDTSSAVCDGLPVRLPSGTDERQRPILVCGSCANATRAVVEHLTEQGLAAWLVVPTHRFGTVGDQTAADAGALKRAE